MDAPTTTRLQDVDREAVQAAIEDLADDAGAVVSVRLEGTFDQVLVRSVPLEDFALPAVPASLRDRRSAMGPGRLRVCRRVPVPRLEPRRDHPGPAPARSGHHPQHGWTQPRPARARRHAERASEPRCGHAATGTLHDGPPGDTAADARGAAGVAARRAVHCRPTGTGLGISEAEAQRRLEWLADRGYVSQGDPQPTGAATWVPPFGCRPPAPRAGSRTCSTHCETTQTPPRSI